ncbi:MAG: RDD family protein [Actinomycetes bacterium]
MTRDIRYAEARALQGHRAGFASRVVADAIDLGVAWLLGLAALLAAGVVHYLLTGPPLRLPVLPNWLGAGAGGAIAVAYLALSWAATGRSVGKQVAGLRVVDRAGRRLSLWRSFCRAVLYVLFPAGLLWVLASRRNASVQDLIVGTAVVYDWAYHAADEPLPTGDGR